MPVPSGNDEFGGGCVSLRNTITAAKSVLWQTSLVSVVIANLPPALPPLPPPLLLTYYRQRWAFGNYLSAAALQQ